jgi:hypothetical protein
MAILNHGSTIRTADGGQSTTTIVTATNIGSYAVASNATYYIGTTQNVFNRASGAQTLTGVSIDGNAANITAYTINQNVGTSNTPSFAGIVSSAITNYAFLQVTDTNNFWITPGNNNWGLYFETSAGGLLGGSGDSNRLGFVGAGAARFYVDLNNGNGWFGASLTANTDSRSPIFYDSNNTAYYIDAASTSVINALSVSTLNNINAANGTWHTSSEGKARFYFASNGTTYFRTGNDYVFRNNSDIGVVVIDSVGNLRTSTSGDNSPSYSLHVGGTGFASADFRAPIFYDSGNTAYYLDPANSGTSLLVAGSVGIGTTSPADKLQVGAGHISIDTGYRYYMDANVGAVSIRKSGTSMVFTVGSNDRVYIDSSGNVGIGTTSPNAKVESYYSSNALTFNYLATNLNNSSPIPVYAFDVTNGSTESRAIKGGIGFERWNPNGGGSLHFYNNSTNDSSNISGTRNSPGNIRMSIDYGGNIGVNTTTPDTNLQVVGHVHVGNQTTFENTGGWNKTIYLDGTVHARMRILGSAFASGKNSATETSIWVDNSVAPYSGLDTNAGSFRINAGFTTMLNSARSPLFYDSDNTAYYIDAASTSVLNAAQITTTYTNNIAKLTNGSPIVINSGFNASLALRVYYDMNLYNTLTFTDGSWNSQGSIYGSSSVVNIVAATATTTFTKYAGYSQETGSFRAPIFYDSDNTGYYIDAASTSVLNVLNVVDANLELYKSQTVDMSNTTTYSTSNYYPVTIEVPTEGCIIQIQNNLNSNVPSWATHGSGFTLNLKWRTNGSGWGTTAVRRIIDQYFEQFTNQTICGGITQMINSSTEVVWLRGGGQYLFKFSRNLSAVARSTTYTVSSQSVSPTSTAQNTVWNAYSGAEIKYNDQTISTSNMYTPVLYDWNNSAYYVDPASTSNLVGLTVANTITGNISGSSGSCTGNAATATRTSGQSGYPHAGTGMWAFYNWGGSDGGTSAPSASTYTTGLSVGSNPGDQAYGFQIANNMWNTGLWTRNYNSSFGSWIRLLDSSNYVGYSAFTGNVDGTQFRDANDTSFYLDPAGTSNLNKFSTLTMSYNDMNSMHVNSPYVNRYNGSSLYRNGTMGYGTVDCNVMFSNWGSGFIDSWSSPANAPGGSTHYVGLQGFHYNHVNNSQAYGFQMLCAGEADNRFFWRSAWPNLRSWVEMIHSGNIGSQTVATAGSCTGNSATVTNGVYTGTNNTLTGVNYFRSDKGSTSTVGANSNYALQAFSNDAGAAGMSFHRGGYYAVNMGLDPDNVLRIGGWSASANRLQLDMSGNLTVAGAMYGTNFIDSDNTAYFCNPASTSNLVGLTVANTITGSISGNAANVTGTVAIANGGTGATSAANARTNLGATTAGSNLFTLTNPSAVTFLRVNADNTVSALNASDFRTAIGANSGETSTNQSLSGTTGCTIDVAAATVHILTLSNATTISSITYNNRSNNPAVNTLLIVLKFLGTASVTWSNVVWSNGTTPTLTGTNGKADVYALTSYKGGTTGPAWIGSVVGQNIDSTNL